MEQFNLELKNAFDILPIDSNENPEIQYRNLIQNIATATKKMKGTRRNNNKLSSNTISLIQNREILKNNRPEYNKIDRLVKRSIRKDIRDCNTNMIKVALRRNTSLRFARQGITKGKSWISTLKDENGMKQNSSHKIVEIATQFYKRLYQNQHKQLRYFTYYCPDSVPPISIFEVQRALSKMRYNKSPGADEITTEILKLGRSVLVPNITYFYNNILYTGEIPSEFCHSNIILLHKKGDKAEISNYRPISLISHLYKLFIRILENRIAPILDLHQPTEQAGFRPHFSTTDHLHTINQVIEKYNEFSKPLYVAFVDYAKAFDSIHHNSVFDALESQNVPHTYIDLIDKVYRISSANIKLHTAGTNFYVERGVKQGDPLSPKLFTSALQEVFKKLPDSWQSRGINISGHQLTNLRFADDIVLFSASHSELEDMLQDLSTASLEVGLTMNRSKTQLMTNSTKRRVVVDGQELQYVDEYIYLGQIISFKNRQEKEVERRIQNAWKSFWALKEHLKGSLPMTLKRKLIDMCVLPVLTYGAQSWSLTEQQKSKLKICQRAMERSIVGVKLSDRVRNTTLRSITQVTDVGEKTARLKWEWAGHVARMQPDRWAKIVTHWTPEGHRRRGRPRRRWCDDLVSYAGRAWSEIAMNRVVWKKKGEAFAQQWDLK